MHFSFQSSFGKDEREKAWSESYRLRWLSITITWKYLIEAKCTRKIDYV